MEVGQWKFSTFFKSNHMKRILVYKNKIPRITTEQMIEVDRLMMKKYHIDLIQMMENAGRCLAILARDQFLKKSLKKKQVIVLAGSGGNGGGALVCARRLYNWGVNVKVYLSREPDRMTPIAAHQLTCLKQMGVEINHGKTLSNNFKADLIIDGMIGYSIKGNPIGTTKRMITWANAQTIPKLSLDTPSGLDLTSGKVYTPAVNANATLTLALPKKGLFSSNALKIRGALFLGDISVPKELYAEKQLKLKVPKSLFAMADVLKIDADKYSKPKHSKVKKKKK